MWLPLRIKSQADRPLGVELAGYLNSAVGVGEAARLYIEALQAAGVPVLERDVPLPGRDTVESKAAIHPRPKPNEITFNLLCLNPEQMIPYLDGPEAPRREGRRTIGIWSWEVDVLPPGWADAASEVTEIWTYSHFAARLIGAGISAPVIGIPPPVSEITSHMAAEPQCLPDGFRFLTMFDYLSTLERKNPLGVIVAYQRAFSSDDGTVLIVKSVNARHRPERRADLTRLAQGRRDIVFLDDLMSAEERDALLRSCDCYVSLHRSEGHGLPLAEAMASGKPVVATAYGGNTEFMTDDNSYLVRWTPVLVGPDVEHYPAEARWAEPDVEHAAHLLRAVRENTGEMRHKVQRARADVCARLSTAVVGEKMRERMEYVKATNSSNQR